MRATCSLDVLRRVGCFSVRFGSGTGETGAAAVLVDGRLVSADVLLAAQADGHEVTTVESLNVATGELDPIQEAFVETGRSSPGTRPARWCWRPRPSSNVAPTPPRTRSATRSAGSSTARPAT